MDGNASYRRCSPRGHAGSTRWAARFHRVARLSIPSRLPLYPLTSPDRDRQTLALAHGPR